MTARLDWQRDGQDWPNRAASRFVTVAGVRFHVQIAGTGPVLLLLHGMGAATHSWRGQLPLLTPHFSVVAPDLPGHGFTAMPATGDLSLPSMARLVSALTQELNAPPSLILGHSAGAAVAVRMALDRYATLRRIISLNGALLPLRSFAARFFTPTARLLVRLPLVPSLFTTLAGDEAAVARLLHDTGSRIDPVGLRLYSRLVRSPGHVAAALRMMAQWDLPALARDLPRLAVPLTLVAARNDHTVPPSEIQRVRALLPSARTVLLPGLGHLAHEERPDLILPLLQAADIAAPAQALAEATG